MRHGSISSASRIATKREDYIVLEKKIESVVGSVVGLRTSRATTTIGCYNKIYIENTTRDTVCYLKLLEEFMTCSYGNQMQVV